MRDPASVQVASMDKETLELPGRTFRSKKSTKRAATLILGAAFVCPAFAADKAVPPRTLFTNVHVFDGVNAQRIENASVLVEGNLIKHVSTDAIDVAGATVITSNDGELLNRSGKRNPLEDVSILGDGGKNIPLIKTYWMVHKNRLD